MSSHLAHQIDNTVTDGNYFPQPPILHDHLRPSPNPDQTNPSLIAGYPDSASPNAPTPLPPSHPQFSSQPNPQGQQPHRQPNLPHGSNPNHHTMPINDPTKTTIAFDMYIPTTQNTQYQQNHPAGCDCCPHHHRRKDGNKILYRHLKQPTWSQYLKDKVYFSWEFLKHTYWHLEPWVFRPLLAGIAYNVGIQLARVLIQTFFPTYFPTTVYLPLRANAKFYDLHARRVQISADESPILPPTENSPPLEKQV